MGTGAASLSVLGVVVLRPGLVYLGFVFLTPLSGGDAVCFIPSCFPFPLLSLHSQFRSLPFMMSLLVFCVTKVQNGISLFLNLCSGVLVLSR